MVQKTVTIKNKTGLHARPAVMLVKATEKYNCDVKIQKNDIEVDAKSIMALLMLEACKGTKLTIKCDGPDESKALDKVVELVDSGFENAFK
ncbi:MAG: HPr family phosphocarrier protein [Candidatus Zixiibacteriota bacterium]